MSELSPMTDTAPATRRTDDAPVRFGVIGAGFIAYLVIQLARRRGREVHPLIWGASVLFIIYFTLAPIKAILGVA